MHRTLSLAGIFLLAVTVPVFSQEHKSSFWDTPKQEPAKAAPAAKPAAPAATTAKTTAAKTTAATAPDKAKSFWDTPRETTTTAWTGWNSPGGGAKTEPAAAAAAPEPKRPESAATPTKAAISRLANDAVPAMAHATPAASPAARAKASPEPARAPSASPAEQAAKPMGKPAYAPAATRAPRPPGSAARMARPLEAPAKDYGVRLSFLDLEATGAAPAPPATETVTPDVPAIETGAPEGLTSAAEPQQFTPPTAQPAPPMAPRLPGAAPAKSQASPWLKVTGQYRGKVEDWNTGFAVADSYYLNRLRLQAEVLPSTWFRAVVQVQDARTADYSLAVVPTNMYNQFDVRLAFADIKHKQSGTTFRAGRQEFNFGEGRLVSAGDWSNVGRSFDGASAQWARKQGLLTVFASSLVVIDSTGVDELKHGEQFYGGLYTWTAKKTKRLFEPYVFVKSQDRAIDERGNVGDALITTVGMRAVGPITPHFDYNVDTAVQGGHYAQDDHDAWAVHVGGGTTFGGSWKPRVGVDYDAASGDGTAKDGKRQTFDVLFGTNHAKFGLVDNIAWRNMEHVGVVFTATPVKEIKVTSGYHRTWIRDVKDGYYVGAGSKVKTKATNEQLFGDEIDLQVAVDLTKHISVLFGTGYMFAGPYQALGVGRDNAFHQFFLWKVVF